MKWFRNLTVICVTASCIAGSSVAARVSPPDSSVLSYTQVLFQWPYSPGAIQYHLQIARDEATTGGDAFIDALVSEYTDSTTITIVREGLAWDQSYFWRVRPIRTSGVAGSWSPVHSFTIAPLLDRVPIVTTELYDSSRYEPGLTLFSPRGRSILMAVDWSGEPVWFGDFLPDNNWPWFSQFLPWGTILAIASDSHLYGGFEIDLNGNRVWMSGTGLGIHHHAIAMPGANFMAITKEFRMEHIPEGPWKSQFDLAGIDSLSWRGDRLVEWDRDGNEVWSWSTFDHYSTADWDSIVFTYAYNRGFHDWTHSNEIYFDSGESAIYLSARHQSRITKIDYPSGEIIWNMGRPMASGDVRLGNDLGFSWQHAISLLPNGNLLLFDNGTHNQPAQSRALEISLVQTDSGLVAKIAWEYVLPDSLYTSSRGDADRLPGGNTLITAALRGQVLEVGADSSLIWRMDSGGLELQRSERIPGLYPVALSMTLLEAKGEDWETPVLSLPVGGSTIQLVLRNEGWQAAVCNYGYTDELGHQDIGLFTLDPGEVAIVPIEVWLDSTQAVYHLRLWAGPQYYAAGFDTMELILMPQAVPDSTPGSYWLYRAAPNPFKTSTVIGFDLPKETELRLVVLDLLGREVALLAHGRFIAAYHSIRWLGTDRWGRTAPSGIYIARLVTPAYTSSIKMLLLK